MEDLNYLILVRHGQSEWNAKNLFTGWKDPDLTDQGRNEAEKAGKLLLEKKIGLDELFTSVLIRAINTCLLYTSPSPRDGLLSRMPSSA